MDELTFINLNFRELKNDTAYSAAEIEKLVKIEIKI
jgi:hypothetical protein